MRLPRGLKPPTVQEQGPATMLPVAGPATVRRTSSGFGGSGDDPASG